MKYVVAVSGGVDSVVLLDMLVQDRGHELVVAHFDHGIRSDSADDARFVEGLARSYGLVCEMKREELGVRASEEQARTRRYAFLRTVTRKHNARLVTAHHQDDIVETISINLTRGTGWRGLAVLGDESIERPLLRLSKRDIYDYSTAHNLEWVQDSTNLGDKYLRNRIRRKHAAIPNAAKRTLIELWEQQAGLADEIDNEVKTLATQSRYFMTMIDEASALEVLRGILAQSGLSLTRPQRARMLHAIKTARPGTTLEAGPHTTVSFTPREFVVKHP